MASLKKLKAQKSKRILTVTLPDPILKILRQLKKDSGLSHGEIVGVALQLLRDHEAQFSKVQSAEQSEPTQAPDPEGYQEALADMAEMVSK